eukprot:1175460-Prorocentrum_minimum.AAC.3
MTWRGVAESKRIETLFTLFYPPSTGVRAIGPDSAGQPPIRTIATTFDSYGCDRPAELVPRFPMGHPTVRSAGQ